jgi:hypothetical protein
MNRLKIYITLRCQKPEKSPRHKLANNINLIVAYLLKARTVEPENAVAR